MSVNLFSLLVVLLVGLTGLLAVAARNITKNVNEYLRARIGNENFVWLKNTVATVVGMLMQAPAYKDLAGPEKKQIAMAKIQEYLRLAGVLVTTHEIDDLIEACVAEFKKVVTEPLIFAEAK